MKKSFPEILRRIVPLKAVLRAYLLEHPGFRQAPVATLSRLLWRRLCSEFGIPAVVDLPGRDGHSSSAGAGAGA